MALNKTRKSPTTAKTQTAEFEDFVAKGGTVADTAPTRSSRARKAPAAAPEAPAWQQRASSAKKTEAQPFRYNRAQQRLLEHAKQVEGRDYSKILAEIVWPALEEKYGAEVPLDDA